MAVWIINDQQDYSTYIGYVLGTRSINHRWFPSAEKALENLIPSDQPDLIMLDIRMPGMDGNEFMRRLQSANCFSPIVVMTADDTLVAADVRHIPVEIVHKPMKVPKIFELIDRWSARQIIPTSRTQRFLSGLDRNRAVIAWACGGLLAALLALIAALAALRK